jgi:uncharacterized membrane protein YqjE
MKRKLIRFIESEEGRIWSLLVLVCIGFACCKLRIPDADYESMAVFSVLVVILLDSHTRLCQAAKMGVLYLLLFITAAGCASNIGCAPQMLLTTIVLIFGMHSHPKDSRVRGRRQFQ